ncbi:hypothetical protein GC176_07210 [bacterium]|nr:hypothetical protein [bacterium]
MDQSNVTLSAGKGGSRSTTDFQSVWSSTSSTAHPVRGDAQPTDRTRRCTNCYRRIVKRQSRSRFSRSRSGESLRSRDSARSRPRSPRSRSPSRRSPSRRSPASRPRSPSRRSRSPSR